jgi:hypothetical protein
MLACGSELRFRRRWTSLTLLLTSLNSASSWPSSTEAVRIRPEVYQYTNNDVWPFNCVPSKREMIVCLIMIEGWLSALEVLKKAPRRVKRSVCLPRNGEVVVLRIRVERQAGQHSRVTMRSAEVSLGRNNIPPRPHLSLQRLQTRNPRLLVIVESITIESLEASAVPAKGVPETEGETDLARQQRGRRRHARSATHHRRLMIP